MDEKWKATLAIDPSGTGAVLHIALKLRELASQETISREELDRVTDELVSLAHALGERAQ